MDFFDQKRTFQSVFFAEKLRLYINFSDQDLCQLEAEFLSLQSITLGDMLEEALKEVAMRHGNEELQSFTKSISFVATCGFKNFITCLTSCDRCFASFTAMYIHSKSSFFTRQGQFDLTGFVFRIRWNSFKYSKLLVELASWREILSVRVVKKGNNKVQESRTIIQRGTFQYKQEQTLKLWLFYIYLRCRNSSCETVKIFQHRCSFIN